MIQLSSGGLPTFESFPQELTRASVSVSSRLRWAVWFSLRADATRDPGAAWRSCQSCAWWRSPLSSRRCPTEKSLQISSSICNKGACQRRGRACIKWSPRELHCIWVTGRSRRWHKTGNVQAEWRAQIWLVTSFDPSVCPTVCTSITFPTLLKLHNSFITSFKNCCSASTSVQIFNHDLASRSLSQTRHSVCWVFIRMPWLTRHMMNEHNIEQKLTEVLNFLSSLMQAWMRSSSACWHATMAGVIWMCASTMSTWQQNRLVQCVSAGKCQSWADQWGNQMQKKYPFVFDKKSHLIIHQNTHQSELCSALTPQNCQNHKRNTTDL